MDSIVDKVLILRLSKESKLYIKNNIGPRIKSVQVK